MSKETQITEKMEMALAKAFAGYEDSYVIIGGTACSVVLKDRSMPFRGTRDIDMVVRTDGHLQEFAGKLWAYIADGGYRYGQRSRHTPNVYRFTDPSADGFPQVIELFSSRPRFPIEAGAFKTPIHISDDIYSLSAIILNDSYYQLLQQGSIIVNGLSVLDAGYLIPFKAKAWLDLRNTDADGKDIRKHKKDVFRLAAALDDGESIELTPEPKRDLAVFLEAMETEQVPLKEIGIHDSKESLIELMREVYLFS